MTALIVVGALLTLFGAVSTVRTATASPQGSHHSR